MSLLNGLLLLTARTVLEVHGFSNGIVNAACNSMVPGHDVAPQTSTAPYTISTSEGLFDPGDEITVTVAANLGNNFKGFLLEARQLPEGQHSVGHFRSVDSNTQTLDCIKKKEAVSHIINDPKKQIKTVWISPQEHVGDVEFRATVLQNLYTFWINVSAALKSSFVVPTQSNKIQISDQCSITEFCFINPPECNPELPNCYSMSVEKRDNGGQRFKITGSSDGYISVGLSHDMFMGKDDVYICALGSNGKVSVVHAYTTGRTTPIPHTQKSVVNITTAYENGIIKCAFTSKNVPQNRRYYILYAHGAVSNGHIQKHQSYPFISKIKVDISRPNPLHERTQSGVIIKAHGALMLTAWMCVGSIGMIIARYFRSAWKGKQLKGKDLWFRIHRTLTLCAIGMTLIAFVLSFVHVQSLSSSASPHPFMGIVVMGFSLLQLTVAIIRPAPGEKWRLFFNWVHRVIALLIKVLAVVTIFFGIQLMPQSNDWNVYIMGGFVAWEALFCIVMEIIQHCAKNESQGNRDPKMTQQTIMLILYFCGNLFFLIFLLIRISNS